MYQLTLSGESQKYYELKESQDSKGRILNSSLVCECGQKVYTWDETDIYCKVCRRRYIQSLAPKQFVHQGYVCPVCERSTDMIYPLFHHNFKFMCSSCVKLSLNQLVETREQVSSAINELKKIRIVESI